MDAAVIEPGSDLVEEHDGIGAREDRSQSSASFAARTRGAPPVRRRNPRRDPGRPASRTRARASPPCGANAAVESANTMFSSAVSRGKIRTSWNVRVTPSRATSYCAARVVSRSPKNTRPVIRPDQPADQVEERRLPRAVRADQRGHASRARSRTTRRRRRAPRRTISRDPRDAPSAPVRRALDRHRIQPVEPPGASASRSRAAAAGAGGARTDGRSGISPLGQKRTIATKITP